MKNNNSRIELIYLFLILASNISIHAQRLPFYQNNLTELQKKEIISKLNTKRFNVAQELGNKIFSSESNQGLSGDRDSDQDGLSDDDEILIGTNPLNQDTDGDALIDSWEVGKINNIDLKSLGASPLHKDIFVEMDYMARTTASNGLGPNTNVLYLIQQCFTNSPVSNPDGVNGINIHLLKGDEVTYDSNLWPILPEFAALKKLNFSASRAPIFHYMIWADSYNSGSSSGYSLDIPSSDFVVTLGKWNNGKGGTDQQKVGTFIHELGHNLGLLHGGSENTNYKPNHLSVMNYFFQVTGISRNNGANKEFYFTYQPFILPEINEINILEEEGVGKHSDLASFITMHYDLSGAIVEKEIGRDIDWNSNTIIDSTPFEMDLNNDTRLDKLLATPNEWSQLFFNGGVIGSFSPLMGLIDKSIKEYTILPFIELKEETVKKLDALKQF